MTDGGFTIDMRVPGRKRTVALIVMRGRLKMAIHFKRTDSQALWAARKFSEHEETLVKPAKEFRTMKQALAWIEAELAAEEAKKNGSVAEAGS